MLILELIDWQNLRIFQYEEFFKKIKTNLTIGPQTIHIHTPAKSIRTALFSERLNHDNSSSNERKKINKSSLDLSR
jgi:hypothetical protein